MRVKSGLAEMLKGGVIMDVVDAEQARIAEDAGAVAVMALERVPADIRVPGRRRAHVGSREDPGDPGLGDDPRDGEVPDRAFRRGADPAGARGRLHRRVGGPDARRSRAPRGQVAVHHAVRVRRHQPRRGAAADCRRRSDDPDEGRGRDRRHRQCRHAHARGFGGIRRLQSLREEELYAEAKELRAPYELVRWVAEHGRLPVVTFTAGGIATPADAALCMQLGADGVFVGSGIFKSGDPETRAKAIVEATTHFNDPKILADVSAGLGEPMVGTRPRRCSTPSGSKSAAGSARARRQADGRQRPIPTAEPARLERRPARRSASETPSQGQRLGHRVAASCGIVGSFIPNCASRMIVSAFTWPSALRMSQSARDQIWPSRWTPAVRSSRVMQVAVDRRRQWGTVDVYETESQSATHAASGVGATHVADRDGPVVGKALADRADLDGRAEPNGSCCESWIAWPYSCRMTSASSASSTPPLPKRTTSCLSQEYELSIPSWLIRMSCDSLLTGSPRRPKTEALNVLLRLGDPVVGHHLLEAVVAAVVQEGVLGRVGRVAGLAADVSPVADR